ncbi:diaminopimelate decarboxylase family protein, partial [Streptomyces sp. NPDC056121]
MAVTTVATAIPPQSPDDLSVWPATTVRGPHGDPTVSGVELPDVAEQFGTPVYVLDETDVRERCRAYRSAFPGADVLYAAKAFLCRAMVHWVHEEGLGLDVCSAGELELAVIAGLPPERIVFHGNAQSPEDLRAALRHGVGRIVVDSTSEIARLAAYVPQGTRQRVMARVVPGVAGAGHAVIRTGTDEQKFGLSIADGSAMHAVTRLVEQPGLELTGLHCHIGSQIDTVKPYVVAVRHLVGLMARVRDRHGITLPELDIGGGHA